MLSISGLLLLYSAVVVPFQICIWDYSDPCNTFPTLLFDVVVDTFFLVRLVRGSPIRSCWDSLP